MPRLLRPGQPASCSAASPFSRFTSSAFPPSFLLLSCLFSFLLFFCFFFLNFKTKQKHKKQTQTMKHAVMLVYNLAQTLGWICVFSQLIENLFVQGVDFHHSFFRYRGSVSVPFLFSARWPLGIGDMAVLLQRRHAWKSCFQRLVDEIEHCERCGAALWPKYRHSAHR